MKLKEKKYKVVALEARRYEIEIPAKRSIDAESLAARLPIQDWTEDNEYYDFEIVEVSEIKD